MQDKSRQDETTQYMTIRKIYDDIRQCNIIHDKARQYMALQDNTV